MFEFVYKQFTIGIDAYLGKDLIKLYINGNLVAKYERYDTSEYSETIRKFKLPTMYMYYKLPNSQLLKLHSIDNMVYCYINNKLENEIEITQRYY